MNNPVLENIFARRTIRAYKPDQISQEQLEILTKVAVLSPTATNKQAFHFTIVQNQELILEFEKAIVDCILKSGDEGPIERLKSRNYKTLYNAPTLIVLSAAPAPFADVDAGIAVQSLALAAKSMGLDSVIHGMSRLPLVDNEEYWADKFKFPEGYKITIALALGYGDMPGIDREPDYTKATVIK